MPIRASSLESGVRVFLPLAITPLSVEGQRGDFDASVTGSDWGGLRVWRVNASPMSAMRAQPHIESSTSDDYLLHLRSSYQTCPRTLLPG